MSKLFSIEVTIIATAYIVAESAAEAQGIASDLTDTGIEFGSRRQDIGDDLCVTGESYSEDMPTVSLSPAMTLQGIVWGATVDEVEDFEEA